MKRLLSKSARASVGANWLAALVTRWALTNCWSMSCRTVSLTVRNMLLTRLQAWILTGRSTTSMITLRCIIRTSALPVVANVRRIILLLLIWRKMVWRLHLASSAIRFALTWTLAQRIGSTMAWTLVWTTMSVHQIECLASSMSVIMVHYLR